MSEASPAPCAPSGPSAPPVKCGGALLEICQSMVQHASRLEAVGVTSGEGTDATGIACELQRLPGAGVGGGGLALGPWQPATPRPHSATAVPTPSGVPPGEAGFRLEEQPDRLPPCSAWGLGRRRWPCRLHGWSGVLTCPTPRPSTDCSHCGPGARRQGIALVQSRVRPLSNVCAAVQPRVASSPVHVYFEEPVVSPACG